MSADYQIEIAGGGSNGGVTITEFDSIEFNRNHSAMSDCTAAVKQDTGLEEYMLDNFDIYNNTSNNYVFRGTLESVESSSDSVTTVLKGRGPFLADKQSTDSYTAESEWGENALSNFAVGNSYVLDTVQGTGVNRDKGGPSTAGASTAFEGSQLIGQTSSTDRSNNEKYLKPIGFWAEDGNSFSGTHTLVKDENLTMDFSGGVAARLDATGDNAQNSFTPEHNLDSNYKVWVRAAYPDGESHSLELIVEGTSIGTLSIDNTSGTDSHEWIDVVNDSRFSSSNTLPSLSSGSAASVDLSPSTTPTNYIDIDAIVVTDEDYTYTSPNKEMNNGYYLYPEQYGDSSTRGVIEGAYVDPVDPEDEYGVAIKYKNPIKSHTLGLTGDSTSGVATNTTVTLEEPRQEALAELTLGSTSDYGAPVYYLIGEHPDTLTASGEQNGTRIIQQVVYPANTVQTYFTKQSWDGSRLQIIQDISSTIGYRFAVYDWTNRNAEAYPTGAKSSEPDWDITSYNRTVDYSGYANEVQVKGAYDDSNTRYEATVTDDEEVNDVGKTIAYQEVRSDLTSNAECRVRARGLLNERVQNRSQSGSLSCTPSYITAGYTRPVSVWSDAFKDGGRQGTDALNFEASDSTDNYVSFTATGFSTADVSASVLVFPRFKNMDTYRSLLSANDEPDMLKLHPDGSLTYNHPVSDGSGKSVSTSADAVVDQKSQEVAVESLNDTITIYVDGSAVASKSFSSGTLGTASMGDTYVGTRIAPDFKHTSDTVLFPPLDTEYFDSSNETHDTFDEAGTGVPRMAGSNGTNYSQVSGQVDEGINLGSNTRMEVPNSVADNLDMGLNDWGISFWFKLSSYNTVDLLRKGGLSTSYPGWNVHVNSSDELVFEWADSSTHQTQKIAQSSGGTYYGDLTTGAWHHVFVEVDRDGNLVTEFNGMATDYMSSTANVSSSTDIQSTQDFLMCSYGSASLDEVRIYSRLLTTTEKDYLDTQTSHGGGSTTYDGGVDNIRFWRDGGFESTSPPSRHYKLDDASTPQTAIDSGADGTDGSITGAEYEAAVAPIEEISYSLGDEASMDVKFDIAGRIDTELNRLRRDVSRAQR